MRNVKHYVRRLAK